jgi:hypothetical protein
VIGQKTVGNQGTSTESSTNATKLQYMVAEEHDACLSIIKKYIPILRDPVINIVTGEPDIRLADGKKYPLWIKALSIRDNIFLLADRGTWSRESTKQTLLHEMLHAAIWIYLENKQKIPVWFNEALVHWITKSENIVSNSGYTQSKDRKNIKKGDGEQWFENVHINAQIEVMISHFIRSNYKSDDIANLFRRLKHGESFTAAVKRVLGLNIEHNPYEKKLKNGYLDKPPSSF